MNLDITDSVKIQQYSGLIHQKPVYIWVMNIGENLSLSFNNLMKVKLIELCQHYNKKQVIEDFSAKISNAPPNSFILTITKLLRRKNLFKTVHGKTKAEAVCKTQLNLVNEARISSISLEFSFVVLNLEKDSSFYITNL